MATEKSITKIDQLIGKKIHVIAYGASYIGHLQRVDYDKGVLIMTDGKDVVTLELDRVESFAEVEEES